MKNEKCVNPLISVIIPVYNVEEYVERCILSIINQTYKELEIILVNDGSTDNSLSICSYYASKDPRIKIINKSNGGLSSARNAGLNVCTGDFISFIDSDDWLAIETYEKLINTYSKEKPDIIIFGRYNHYKKTNEKIKGYCPKKYEIINSEETLRRSFLYDCMDFSSCDKLYKSNLWFSFRFPEGKVSEDVGVLYKVIDNAKSILLVPEPFYNYYHRNNSITSSGFYINLMDAYYFCNDIIEYTKNKHSNIVFEAKCFRTTYIIYLLNTILRLPQKDREKYNKEYKLLCKPLRSEKSTWLRNNNINLSGKIRIFLLLFPRLFILLKKIKDFLRRRPC